MAFLFGLKRRHAPSIQPGVDMCSAHEAVRSFGLEHDPRIRSGYSIGRGGHGMGRGGHGHKIHPAVKAGILAAAEDGDAKAIMCAQKRGWLGNTGFEQGEESADPRDSFGGAGRGGLSGVFASQRGRGGHRGGHHESTHGALAGGFGASHAGQDEVGNGAPPDYEEVEGSGHGSAVTRGGRGRDLSSRGNDYFGRGRGHHNNPVMGHSEMGHLPTGGYGGLHGRGRGRGYGHGRGTGHPSSAAHEW